MNNYYKKYPNRPDNIYNNKKLIKNIYHDCTNIKNDLSGINTILSNDFIYFGKNYINLPKKFYEFVPKYQGYKSNKNNNYKNDFINYFKIIKKKYGIGKLGLPIHNKKC